LFSRDSWNEFTDAFSSFEVDRIDMKLECVAVDLFF